MRTSFIWGQRHFMFLPLSQICSKRIFLQVRNDSSIRTIRLFVIWHFLGFRICQIRQDTIVSNVRQQFRAWVRDLFWQQSDWPIHRILKLVIYKKNLRSLGQILFELFLLLTFSTLSTWLLWASHVIQFLDDSIFLCDFWVTRF